MDLTMGLEDAENLASGDALDEGDTVLVTEQNADLRGPQTLLRSLGDHLINLRTNQTHQNHSHRNETRRIGERRMFSLTSATGVLTQAGAVLLYGSADDEIPFLRHTDTEQPSDQMKQTKQSSIATGYGVKGVTRGCACDPWLTAVCLAPATAAAVACSCSGGGTAR
jgi:hypothetical protein